MEDRKECVEGSSRPPSRQRVVYDNDDDSSDDYVSPHSTRRRRKPKRPATPIGNFRYFPSRDWVRASDYLMVLVTIAMVTLPSAGFLFYM